MKKKPQLYFLQKPAYKGFKLEQVATRPNCLDILKQPSRMGNMRYYPDGRVEHV
jgi:hypothetical protein